MKPSRLQATLILPFGAVALAIGALYWMYALAQGLTWQFDDFINLKGLADVSSPEGAVNFVFGGVAGPLGRPLSLITFMANYADWPGNPWGVVQLTFVLHSINGVLVFLLGRRVLLCSDHLESNANRLAMLIAVLWLLLPIHASGVLMPVQRMTHVSAFFVLVALYGYMVLRQRQGGGVPTVAGMAALSAWLAVMGLAAAFSKENGVTVATFVFLLEIFCFYSGWKRHTTGVLGGFWRIWLILAGSIVTLAMAWHVATSWEGILKSFELYRGYRWSEHIATQWVISLEYLRQIVLPRSALLGPFHDNHAVFRWSMVAPYMAILFWGTLLLSALLLARRAGSQSGRVIGWAGCAAVLWFFAGHQVESTVIPLELYFEHRNYLASLGICFWLVLVFDHFLRVAQKKIVPYALAVLYLIYLMFSLHQITSLWGQPLLAHDLWQKNHPNSTRAAQAVIQDLMQLGFQEAAFAFADEFIEKQNAVDVSIQMMPLRCKHRSAGEQEQSFKSLLHLVETLRLPVGITTGLAAFGNVVRDDACASVNDGQYEGFLQLLLAKPQVQHVTTVRHHIHYELALMAKKRMDMDGYIDNLKKAYWDFPSISVAQLIAAALFQEQRIDEGIEWIDGVIEHAPNPSLRMAWRATLQSMRDALVHIRQSLHEAEQPQ